MLNLKECIKKNQARKAALKREEAAIEKYGFHIRYVPQSYQYQTQLFPSIHTVGVQQNFHHPDLELVVPFPPQEAGRFLGTLIDKIKQGENYYPHTLYALPECSYLPFYVVPVHHPWTHEDYLRVILPDKAGYFPHQSKCDTTFSCQESLRQPFLAQDMAVSPKL